MRLYDSVDSNLITGFHQLPAKIRLIDTRDGGQGSVVLDRAAAQDLAEETGLDIYLINPEGVPPVYKLLDYGKFKYEEQRRQRQLQRRQRETTRTVKEIYFTPTIGEHDVEVKLQHVRRLIDDHDVKIAMSLRRGNKFLLTTRWSKPLHVVLGDPSFVLNRVLKQAEEFAQPTKLIITENLAYATLRKRT